MAVIAVFSIKGGVGTTTLATELALRWAGAGQYETLLWDLDPQGGAGFLLGIDEPVHKRAAAIFQRDGRPREAIVGTRHRGLSLLPADTTLRQLPLQLARLGGRRMSQLTAMLRGSYSRIVVDCPAGFTAATEQALDAADAIIVPLPPSPLSMRALDQLRTELLRLHRRHAPILPVLSLYNRNRALHRTAREGDIALWPIIPQSPQIEQIAARQAPLSSFAPNCHADRAIARLWRGIEARIARAPATPGEQLPARSQAEASYA
ncbi:MAG: ParA family protein [Novosphingobium sp.]